MPAQPFCYNLDMNMFKSVNKVIRVLIYSDLAILTGEGFVAPIFAIFLTSNIKGGNIEVAGFAAAVYWIVKSVALIPVGRYLDRTRGEKDDLYFIMLGNLLAAASIIGYIYARLPWHIYVWQAVYGLGMAMNIPGYTAMFTRHVDRGHEAYNWSVRSTFESIGVGVAGALGGVIAYKFGFNALFIIIVIFILLSAFLPLLIFKEIKKIE